MGLKVMGPRLTTGPLRLATPPKTADHHYTTPEHKAWSKAIIARAGGVCERCGATGVKLLADHKIELKDGGDPLDLSNGQALCAKCHGSKTAQSRKQRHQSGNNTNKVQTCRTAK